MRTERNATNSETRPPWITLLSRSLPNWSVPNGLNGPLKVGALASRLKSVLSGSFGATAGAAIAMRISSTPNVPAIAESVLDP